MTYYVSSGTLNPTHSQRRRKYLLVSGYTEAGAEDEGCNMLLTFVQAQNWHSTTGWIVSAAARWYATVGPSAAVASLDSNRRWTLVIAITFCVIVHVNTGKVLSWSQLYAKQAEV